MKVIDIQPRDIAILCEFTIDQLDSLLFCLDNSIINYKSENFKEKQQVEYVTIEFYKILLNLKERIGNVT